MNRKKETEEEAYENYLYALHNCRDSAIIEKYSKIWEAIVEEEK